MKKKYYDSDAIKRIEKLSVNGQISQAYKEINDYFEKYPNDNYSHIVNAEILLSLKRPKEALMEIEEYMNEPMHGYMVEQSICTTYGSILLELGRTEEGIKKLEQAIKIHKREGLSDVCTAQVRLLNYYIRNKELDAALRICRKSKKSPQLFIKKAQILVMKDEFEEALNIISTVRAEDVKESVYFTGQYYYVNGKIYYSLKNLEKAEEYLNKCIELNIDISNRARVLLGHIECDRRNYDKALKLGNDVLGNEIVDKYGYDLLARTNYELYNYDEALLLASKIDHFYWRNYRLARIYYSKKEYEKAEKLFSLVLNCDSFKHFNDNFEYYLLCLFRQGKYEETLYALNWAVYAGFEESQTTRLIRLHIENDMSKYNLNLLPYSSRQVLNYDEKDAIKHIREHHVVNSKISQFNDCNIKKLFYDIKEKILLEDGVAYNFFDKYIFYIQDIGETVKTYRYNEVETINQLEVVTLPGTNKILTMYPRKGTEALLDENIEEDNKKPKRLSRIEKFNLKYGIK